MRKIACALLLVLGLCVPASADDIQTCWGIDESLKWEVRVQACNRIIQSRTSDKSVLAKAHLIRGKDYLEKKMMPQAALDDFNKVSELVPSNTPVYLRSLAYEQLGKFDLALADMTTIVNEDNKGQGRDLYFRIRSYLERARLLEKMGRTADAISDYRKALPLERAENPPGDTSTKALRRLGVQL